MVVHLMIFINKCSTNINKALFLLDNTDTDSSPSEIIEVSYTRSAINRKMVKNIHHEGFSAQQTLFTFPPCAPLTAKLKRVDS